MKYVTAFVLLLALLLLAACGGNDQTPTPTLVPTPTQPAIIVPTPPPGWDSYSRSNFQVALPADWQEVKLTDQALKDAITGAQNSNPPLATELSTLLISGQYKSLLFYATPKNSSSDIAENVAVTRLTMDGAQSIQALAKAYGDALPNVVRGAKLVEQQAPLKVNGMDAASFVYDVSLVDGDGNLQTVRGVQLVYLPVSGDAYVVTVSGDAAQGDKFTALARQIATSFVVDTP